MVSNQKAPGKRKAMVSEGHARKQGRTEHGSCSLQFREFQVGTDSIPSQPVPRWDGHRQPCSQISFHCAALGVNRAQPLWL